MNKKLITLFVLIFIIPLFVLPEGIPVIDLSVIDQLVSIASDLIDFLSDRNVLSELLKDYDKDIFNNFIKVYDKLKYFEYKKISLPDIEDLLNNNPFFRDLDMNNTWWKLWNRVISVWDMYPGLKRKHDDIKNNPLYKSDLKIRSFINNSIESSDIEEKVFENTIDEIILEKEIQNDTFDKVENFNRMIDTASRLTGDNKEETQRQMKIIRVKFYIAQIKFEKFLHKLKKLNQVKESFQEQIKDYFTNIRFAEMYAKSFMED